jgi:spore maturation protein CgeB
MVINRHGEVSKGYSNNMRLFEATGMEAMLLTEDSPNIGQYFNPGNECVTYKDSTDLRSTIDYYLSHQEEMRLIAKAGQAKTLKCHTYDDILIPAHRTLIDSL